MDFFKQIAEVTKTCNLSIVVMQNSNVLSVSILPMNRLKDADNDIKPMIMKGTPEELDAQFFKALISLKKADEAFNNFEIFDKSIKEATKEAESKVKAKTTIKSKTSDTKQISLISDEEKSDVKLTAAIEEVKQTIFPLKEEEKLTEPESEESTSPELELF